MQTVGAFDAKTRFSELLRLVEEGEEILIQKHGHDVARLVPVQNRNLNPVSQTISCLKKFRKGKKLNSMDWREMRDEGRP